MSYEFTKLADVPALEEVPEGANALIEVDGAIRRVPGDGLGGGGFPTAIIHLNPDSASDASIASLADLTGGMATFAAGDNARVSSAATVYTATCDNMTYAEAKAILLAGEILDAKVVVSATVDTAAVSEIVTSTSLGIAELGETPVIGIAFCSVFLSAFADSDIVILYWLEDGTLTSDMSVLGSS